MKNGYYLTTWEDGAVQISYVKGSTYGYCMLHSNGYYVGWVGAIYDPQLIEDLSKKISLKYLKLNSIPLFEGKEE